MDTDLTAEEKADWLEEASDAIRGQMKLLGATPAQAAEQLSRQRAWRNTDAAAILRESLDNIQDIVAGIQPQRGGGTLATPEAKDPVGGWYEGPNLDRDRYWPPVRHDIEEDLGEAALGSIDRASSEVIANSGTPYLPKLNTRGLVLGYVQSGKTTNFLSVIAKAADEGYRLIIVLAGMTNSLREQTQERLQEALTTGQTGQYWTVLTQPNEDFHPNNSLGEKLYNESERQLIIIKKNGHRLKKLNKWLDDVSRKMGRLTAPVLVIDDEADQASVNVAATAREKNRRSVINAQISTLLDRPRTSYIAYTATPFANILIDPNDGTDLYPENFITVLNRPDGYFGSEQLFGRDAVQGEDPADIGESTLDACREIAADDVDAIRPPSRGIDEWSPTLSDSLRDAIRWFLLATATRWIRGQRNKHSSMLVHSSPRVQAHELVAEVVSSAVREMAVKISDPGFRGELEVFWQEENAKQPQNPAYGPGVTFDAVYEMLQSVLDEVKVVVDNGSSDERIDYSEPGQTVIAVGGNTLSRGLTLEGLVCSYFARVSRTYDTLLQMGRWFGFRRGYEDLVRIWMTPSLTEWFHDLATVEADLRRDIASYSYEGLTPADFRAKIRLHPAMQVTSAAKMRNSRKASMSFSGQRVQTIMFREEDTDFLRGNIDTTTEFLAGLRESGKRSWTRAGNGSTVFAGLSSKEIIDFLRAYTFIEDVDDPTQEHKWKLLANYIAKEAELGGLRSWNVSVIGQKRPERGTLDLGLETPVNLVKRTRVSSSTTGRASINTLVSPNDRINDLPFEDDDQWRDFNRSLQGKSINDALLRDKHDDHVGRGVGHLTIYAIDKDSAPDTPKHPAAPRKAAAPGRERKALGAVEHVIALGVFLPDLEEDTPVEYVCGIDTVTQLSEDERDEFLEAQRDFENTLDQEDAADAQEETSNEDQD